MLGRAVVLGLVAACVAAGPASAERLSDERRVTRWAHATQRAALLDAPAGRSIGRLHLLTENDYPEVYLALSRHAALDGSEWIRVRVPAGAGPRTGWVPRDALGRFHRVSTALEIDRRRSRALLRRAGRVVWRAPIGHGAPGTPTPAGRFYVREKLRNLGGDPLYGPWAFGTSAYSDLSDWPAGGVIGIHGTDQPGLIPGRPSHGCVRVRNADITRLARLMPIGTPIHVH